MKTIFSILFLLFSLHQAFTQNIADTYSLLINHPFDKYFNKCFDDLEPFGSLDSQLAAKEENLCSLGILLTSLMAYSGDSLLNKAILSRLRQVAYRFHEEGNPILIIGSGLDSMEQCEKLNQQDNSFGITYITLGNSCISHELVDEGIYVFNSETKRLVNFTGPGIGNK